MPAARSCRLAVVLALSTLAVLALAGTASAALTQTPFGCRASVARATLGSSTSATVEPYVANKDETPCKTDSNGVGIATIPTTTPGATQPALLAGPAGAFTYNAFDPTGATAPGAAAVASVQGVTIPTSSGIVHIVGPVQASATYACVNNRLVANAQSNLNVISVNGVNMPIPAGQQSMIPLGGNSYIAVNQKIVTSNSLTEIILRVHLDGLADIVVGEAQVTKSTLNPCAGTAGQPPVLEICPKGSTLDVVKQRCIIKACGGTIIVSRPFMGPSGGTVVALCVARKRYHSPCLFGPGPKYVLVATKQGARVEGTLYSDRIIAFGRFERIAGLGGNDCINGKAIHQRIYDGNGKERVYASAFARIAIGSGNSLVVGGNGHDTISVANGATRIFGHGGHNRIDAGLGRVRINAGPGPNRVFTPSARAIVNCGSGNNNTAFLRNAAIPYARAHGCTTIVHLI